MLDAYFAAQEAEAEPQLNITDVDLKPGDMKVRFQAGDEAAQAVLLAMAEAMAATLDGVNAPNYAELSVSHRETGRPYILTVQRALKKSPHTLRMEAEARADAAAEKLASISEHADKLLEWHRDGGPAHDYRTGEDLQHHCISCGTTDEYPEEWPCGEYQTASEIKKLASPEKEVAE